MEARKLALPLLVFAGGAILGRVLGLRRLMRGAMTAAAVTGMTARPALLGVDPPRRTARRSRRRKPTRRTSHKKAA
jgi:hypothetical protein